MPWLNKTQRFWQKWQYLLLQENCRLCRRSLHPLIDGMDFKRYRPPAKHLVADQEIISDVLCQFCLSSLASRQSALNTYQYENSDGRLKELLVASGAIFEEPLKTLVYKLKYDNDQLLAKDLACLMYSAWNLLKRADWRPPLRFRRSGFESDRSNAFTLVPVPLHKKRQKQRGYNQAHLLAKQLSCLLNIKVDSKALIRIRNTASQQELGKSQRATNVAGAFQAVKKTAFANQHVILIDDVCTSGSTLIACSKAVMAAGALSVCAMTIAFVP